MTAAAAANRSFSTRQCPYATKTATWESGVSQVAAEERRPIRGLRQTRRGSYLTGRVRARLIGSVLASRHQGHADTAGMLTWKCSELARLSSARRR